MSALSKYAILVALAMVVAVSVFVVASPTVEHLARELELPRPKTVDSIVDPARAAVLEEDMDFQNADRVRSVDGWRSFLSAHPSGVYAQVAKLETERLAAEKAAAPTGLEAANTASADEKSGGKATAAPPTVEEAASTASTRADVSKDAFTPASPKTVDSVVDPARAAVLEEDMDFQNADRVRSVDGWRSFLSAHPSGVYAQVAKLEMERLAAEKAAAPTGLEAANTASADEKSGGKATAAPPTVEEAASTASTRADVSKDAFTPASPKTVDSVVDPARAAVLEEDMDFQYADRVGSVDGWRSFLSAHPSGVYAQAARAEMERLLAAQKSAGPTAAEALNVASADDKTSDAAPHTDVAGSNEDAVAAYNRGEFAIAKRLWLPLAEQGDARAQLGLAVMYFLGQGVQFNMAAALEWCQKAADQGLAAAQYELGHFYEHPWRHELQNFREAARWYRKAAGQNYAAAQDELGAMYEFGLGVPRDYTRAEQWFVKAGDLASVANMYETVADEPSKAANWYRKLADQGDRHAGSRFGKKYRAGNELVRK